VLREVLETALATFAGLLPIANPFSTAVVFLALSRRFSASHRSQQAWRASLYMVLVLWTFLFAGALIMSFFGISIPALRIAGGLIVARIGFGMLASGDGTEQQQAAAADADIAFTPLAVPMLSGPGSIAVTIGMAAGSEGVFEYFAVAGGIVLVGGVSYLVLWQAPRVSALLWNEGLDALTRILGFLLVCVGIQFITVAIGEILADEAFKKPIQQTLHAVAEGQ
jgi:multiple antibiotic resistance protein